MISIDRDTLTRIEKKLDALLKIEEAKVKTKENEFDTGVCNFIGGNTICKIIQDALRDPREDDPAIQGSQDGHT